METKVNSPGMISPILIILKGIRHEIVATRNTIYGYTAGKEPPSVKKRNKFHRPSAVSAILGGNKQRGLFEQRPVISRRNDLPSLKQLSQQDLNSGPNLASKYSDFQGKLFGTKIKGRLFSLEHKIFLRSRGCKRFGGWGIVGELGR